VFWTIRLVHWAAIRNRLYPSRPGCTLRRSQSSKPGIRFVACATLPSPAYPPAELPIRYSLVRSGGTVEGRCAAKRSGCKLLALASSSPRQVAALTASAAARLTWEAPSADVRWRPVLSVAIVTHLVTRSLASPCCERLWISFCWLSMRPR
jgi:hypothetical protein